MDKVLDISSSRLRTFLTVVRTGSVRAAAAELHVTEPAVSTAIGQLARQLGAELFTREGRGLRITPAGEVYADYCRTINGLFEQAQTAVQSAEELSLIHISEPTRPY